MRTNKNMNNKVWKVTERCPFGFYQGGIDTGSLIPENTTEVLMVLDLIGQANSFRRHPDDVMRADEFEHFRAPIARWAHKHIMRIVNGDDTKVVVESFLNPPKESGVIWGDGGEIWGLMDYVGEMDEKPLKAGEKVYIQNDTPRWKVFLDQEEGQDEVTLVDDDGHQCSAPRQILRRV